jgi:hypothetical protein
MGTKKKYGKNHYQIQCVRDTIIGKEKDGLDASFERGLLRSWGKYAGWEEALEPIVSQPQSKSGRVKPRGGAKRQPIASATSTDRG